MPNASACFRAFSRKSAILEFLLWAAASAAKLSGYCGMEKIPTPQLLLDIAAAYCKKKVNHRFNLYKKKCRTTWWAAEIRAGSNADENAADADEKCWDTDDDELDPRIAGRLT